MEQKESEKTHKDKSDWVTWDKILRRTWGNVSALPGALWGVCVWCVRVCGVCVCVACGVCVGVRVCGCVCVCFPR